MCIFKLVHDATTFLFGVQDPILRLHVYIYWYGAIVLLLLQIRSLPPRFVRIGVILALRYRVRVAKLS
jgi:hypothetical protein